jgi:hypothetical protein
MRWCRVTAALDVATAGGANPNLYAGTTGNGNSVGATVAGNVSGGDIVSAIIDAGVEDMIKTRVPLAGPEAEKVAEALRLATPASCQAK